MNSFYLGGEDKFKQRMSRNIKNKRLLSRHSVIAPGREQCDAPPWNWDPDAVTHSMLYGENQCEKCGAPYPFDDECSGEVVVEPAVHAKTVYLLNCISCPHLTVHLGVQPVEHRCSVGSDQVIPDPFTDGAFPSFCPLK